jgi:hypothetical protein
VGTDTEGQGTLTVDPALADAGNRASSAINLALLTGDIGRWIALRLADGSTDGTTYDTRADAIRHQFHEQLCCYVKVPPDGMPPEHATRFIQLNRALYDAGYRLADPDMPGEPIYPLTIEEMVSWLKT